MLIIPRATEKTYREQTKRTYVFVVPRSASKQAVAEAVAAEYSVTVTDVRALNRKGKATRFSRGRHAFPGTTYRQDKKYAYVTLKDGDSIKIFEDEVATEAAAAEEVAKADKKAADKKAAKAEKGDK